MGDPQHQHPRRRLPPANSTCPEGQAGEVGMSIIAIMLTLLGATTFEGRFGHWPTYNDASDPRAGYAVDHHKRRPADSTPPARVLHRNDSLYIDIA
jgi:hypothetical protein